MGHLVVTEGDPVSAGRRDSSHSTVMSGGHEISGAQGMTLTSVVSLLLHSVARQVTTTS